MRRLLLTALALLTVACGADDGGVEVGTTGTTDAPTTTAEPARLYESSATVLESPEHGPELCLGGVEDSFPPQCGGPALIGWDWAQADGDESSNGTTWGDYHVVGTWDGEALTVTEPPGPPQYGEAPDIDFSPVCDEPIGDPGVPQDETLSLQDIPDKVRVFVSHDPFVVNLVVRPGALDAATAEARSRWPGLLCVVERDEPTEAELVAAQSEVLELQGQDSPLGEQLGSGIYALDPYVNVSVVVLTEEAQAYAQERWGDLVRLNGRLQPVDD